MKEVYLAKVSYTNHIDTEGLAHDISKMCSASPADVLMHLRAMEEYIGARIAIGNAVKLNTLGTFYPAIHASAVESPKR